MLLCDIIIIIWVLGNPHLVIKVEQLLDLYFELFNKYLSEQYASGYGRCQFTVKKNVTASNQLMERVCPWWAAAFNKTRLENCTRSM